LENRIAEDVFTPDRVELLKMLSTQAAISLEIARQIEKLGKQERLRKEMELAKQIQTAILPKKFGHPELEIEAVMLTADEVGGDYYDVLTAKDGSLWLGIGDVCGHGVTPGLIMMMAQTVHATIAMYHHYSPAEVVIMLNQMLYHNVQQRLGEDLFMTFTSLKYLGDGHFQHAGAHLDIIIHRAGAGECELIHTHGTWLNLIPDISYATENAEFTLEVGDTLVLYTDGLTEAHNAQEKLLDVSGFIDIVNVHADKALAAMRDAIMQDVLAWCDQVRDDDMSLVVVRRK
jgi:serine phosphatase RsbU (regulator of sigma subunit)